MDIATQITQQVEALASELKQRKWTITCAESCTGGGIASALTSISGSSVWFHQSWVTYSNQAKQDLVGVPPSILDEFGAVSLQTVEAMAKGAATRAGADIAIAVSGIAGPSGGSKDKPVGLVCLGIVVEGHCFSEQRIFSGNRETVRNKTILYSLEKLNQRLVAL